jgi:probable rRNA maturation factor
MLFKQSVAMKNTSGVPPKSPLIVYFDYKYGALPDNLLIRTARNIYATKKIPLARKTHVIFCSDHTIAKLNAMFRGKNHATDVLSFNYDDDDLLGEIYISLNRARVQARHYKVTYDNEVIRLFIHGMFHLLGFDHERARDRRKMEAQESQYL